MKKDTMKKIKIYALQMSYEVPSEEKYIANSALINLDHLLKILTSCDNHLDLIYTPFKDNPNIPPDQIFKARAALRRYRDKVAENFNALKRQAFKSFSLLQKFSSDTQVVKLIKSFVLSISDIEKQVNRFIDLFSNLKSKEFGQGITKGIEGIKKELAELKQIVEDRIKNHIQKNILARNWVDSISEELQEKIENKIPQSVQLVNERNEKIEKSKNTA